MSKRPDAEANDNLYKTSKLSRLYLKEEFELNKPPKLPRKWIVPFLSVAVFCTGLGLALTVTMQETKQAEPEETTPKTEAFRWAVNRAMSAAELTQTANSPEEWSTIALWWKEAADFMSAVPKSHPRYELAQQKVNEYQRNLDYALRAEVKAASSFPSTELWSIGTHRVDVIRVQGQPTQAARYDSLCQEILYYGKSTIELNNGTVVSYDDIDRNLKAVPNNEMTTTPGSNAFTWTLGSTRATVFDIQGTPDRVSRYDSLGKETLYYGNSTVELTEDKVTGYSNLSNNLRVEIATLPTGSPEEINGYWSVGAERNSVLRVQGTPTQVSFDRSSCKEVLHYGMSTVELRNGFVAGYDNLDKNLLVRVQ